MWQSSFQIRLERIKTHSLCLFNYDTHQIRPWLTIAADAGLAALLGVEVDFYHYFSRSPVPERIRNFVLIVNPPYIELVSNSGRAESLLINRRCLISSTYGDLGTMSAEKVVNRIMGSEIRTSY